MAFDTWVLYTLTVFAVCMTPGPNILLGMTTTVQHGLKATAVGATGAITATTVMGVISATGLGAILLASEQAFVALKWAGGAYLFYLGLRMWLTKKPLIGGEGFDDQPAVSFKKVYLKGMMVSGSNPKGIIFFGALYPLFLDPNAPIVMQFVLMQVTFMFFSWGSIVFYGALSRQMKPLLRRKTVSGWFNRVSGSLFMLIGISLAISDERQP